MLSISVNKHFKLMCLFYVHKFYRNESSTRPVMSFRIFHFSACFLRSLNFRTARAASTGGLKRNANYQKFKRNSKNLPLDHVAIINLIKSRFKILEIPRSTNHSKLGYKIIFHGKSIWKFSFEFFCGTSFYRNFPEKNDYYLRLYSRQLSATDARCYFPIGKTKSTI